MPRANTSRPSLLRRLVEAMPEPDAVGAARGRTVEIDLSQPLEPLRPDGFDRAHVLVLRDDEPLGVVDVDLAHGTVEPSALRELVVRQLGPVAEATAGAAPRRARPPSDGQRPAVSVVIATRDRADRLQACLASLMELDYPRFDVVVVDNAPSDDTTRDCVERFVAGGAPVRYLREPRAGVSLARNAGARLAEGEIVAFTDDDVIVHPRWLDALVDGFAADARITCVTGLTLPGSLENAAEQAFEDYGGMTLGFERRVFDRDTEDPPVRLYPYSAGIFGASNNVAFRRDAFFAHGGFDLSLGPGTPAYGAEDLDLFLAVILSGERILYEPRAMVRHEHRSDFQSLYWQVFTYSAGMTAFLTKWLVSDRRVAADLARRVPALLPAALVHARRGDDGGQHGSYLPQLRWLERAGFLYGPLAYLRSRAVARSRGRRA